MTPRNAVKDDRLSLGARWHDCQQQLAGRREADCAPPRTAWSSATEKPGGGGDLPAEFMDPHWLSGLRRWEQAGVIEYAAEQLRYGLQDLGLEAHQVDVLVWQFGESAEQWLFIGHAGEQRVRCRQELHTDVGRLLDKALKVEQLEQACQLFSEAWLLMHVWDSPEINVRLAHGVLQQEIRRCLAYSIVKESLRGSAAHLMLYITACSPQSPFFFELDVQLQRVKPDTAAVVDAYRLFFKVVLQRIQQPTTAH